jgi:hypothetical protein
MPFQSAMTTCARKQKNGNGRCQVGEFSQQTIAGHGTGIKDRISQNNTYFCP